ncbi:hypothetical protein BpHYR1_031899 [Brachionus plicatilis]|uniref:Uncharacterized protein n=1 Tax=Brachionus plicatilis TaxID=10195 RepID=A0A3M7R9I6_BRAPC|nr:hypothetical protein BpHYR1_031899 [Brachionus plicatilis]
MPIDRYFSNLGIIWLVHGKPVNGPYSCQILLYSYLFYSSAQRAYEFSLTFNKYHLTESPFKIDIAESSDKSEVKLCHTAADPRQLITDQQLNDSNIEYELSNWNQQINNSLNKIMESANQSQNKRSLSPITDTSEEESDSLVYRGETYIENVERLPDGTSHLLLRLDDNSDLIDSSNPNKARGRYKYRLKRIPLPESWNSQQVAESVATNQFNDTAIDLGDNFAEDFDPELMALAERQDMARTGPGGFMRRISNLEDIKEETETYSSSSQKSSSVALGTKRKESSKSKHFKVDCNDRSFDSCETLGDVVRSLTLSETESEGEVNVGNESSVTKITREKQKKMNLEKTVIIEENCVIEPKSALVSKIPKPIGSENNSTSHATKSSLDNELKITTNEWGKNKPKSKEKIALRQKMEPGGVGGKVVLTDDKLSEKFKPEESIQYEYEHVIEDRSQHNTPEPDDKKNVKMENVQLKKTQSETKEKCKRTDECGSDSLRTTTTQKTVLITETQEDTIVETIENEKSTQEFSYTQKRGRDGKLSNLKNNLAQLAERLNPILVQQDESLHAATHKKKPTQIDDHKLYVLGTESGSDKDLSSAPPSFSSYENIVEYYKLQPSQLSQNGPVEQNGTILLEPVDLDQFQTGEQFKPDESVSYHELASFSRAMGSRVTTEETRTKQDDEDSLAEIEENFVITFKSPLEHEALVESELVPLPVRSDHHKAADFGAPESKSLDQIKAKFEAKDSQSDANGSKCGVGKLPKSKFEIYSRENSKSSESDGSSSRRPSLTHLNLEPRTKVEKVSKNLEFSKREDLTHHQMSTDSLDKGVKSLLNKYERNSSRESTTREMTSDSLDSKPIRKLSQNIVQLFDRKDSSDSLGNRSRSSFRSSGSEEHQNRLSKSSHSSPRSEPADHNDEVFLDQKESEPSDLASSKVRKLSKIFNQKSRQNSQSDSARASEHKSRFESKIPKPDTKTREKKLSDSFRKFEEQSKLLYEKNGDAEPAVNDPGVKDLVSKYEPNIKKIVTTLIDDCKPDPGVHLSDTSSTSTKRFSSSSDRTLSPSSPTTKEFKQEEKNIKKLISKYEIPKMLENLLEPNEIYSVEENLQKFDIDLPKKQSREHSVDHFFQSEEKGVKKLVDIYDKKPGSSSKHSISSDSLNTKSVPTNTENSCAAKKCPHLFESIGRDPIHRDFFSNAKESQVETANSVYENELTNLTAVVHIPGQTRGLKKGPKIRALLRIDTEEELRFSVTTESGHRVPFKVKRKDKVSFLMFCYHRVVDFSVGILNKSERKPLPQKYRAQLEIKITDEYDFKIVKRDNLELIPIEVKKNSENIYEISFEPSSTSSYILQASKKLRN